MSVIDRLLNSVVHENKEWIKEQGFLSEVEDTCLAETVNRWIEQIGEGA